MGYTETFIYMGISALVFIFSNWKSRKDYVPGEPDLIPYNGLQYIGLVFVFVFAAHLITLYTGQPLKSRFGF